MLKENNPSIDLSLYHYLYKFYQYNKFSIQKSYRTLSLKLLQYNEENGYLRKPQLEALEMYIFLKEFCSNSQVIDIMTSFYHGKGIFANTKIDELESIPNKLLEDMRSTSRLYANYIFALTMGTGKTILMATCIFYEFILANKYEKDEHYCHNALVFAPDKTVLQSLREIETFDKTQVIPPEYVNWLDMNLKFHFLDDVNTTLSILDYSEFNIIITNTQKIILKKQHTQPSYADTLFSGLNIKKENSVINEIQDLYNMDLLYENNALLKSNQRFEKLKRIGQLGVYVDEAHHAFGKILENDLEVTEKNSLRATIDNLSKKLEEAGTKIVACYNYTGTPYVKNKILPEVVYSFGLRDAIDHNYLKEVELRTYENPTSKEFLKIIIRDFWEKYGETRYEGMLPKLAIFASRIEEVEEELKPQVEEILNEIRIPANKILVNVGDSKLTTNDDIREFINLDTEASNKQFILLVNKGKEGWNCRSLFGVGLYRKPKSKIFVLQATMRCMRAITDSQQKATVYLSEDNYHILEKELSENFRISPEDLKNKTEYKKYNVKLVPPPVKITLKRLRKNYNLIEKKIPDKVKLDMDKAIIEQYQIKETVQNGFDTIKKEKNENDLTYLKDKREYSNITLTAEISRYLNKPCLFIDKLLKKSSDGIEKIISKVNEYNELLYDWVIPRLFHLIYDLEETEDNNEEVTFDLTKDPGEKGYTIISKDKK